ncbi:hypothetical protein T439DRAFT_342036 [Meredithblackwellia eburnea MCA 4105]
MSTTIFTATATEGREWSTFLAVPTATKAAAQSILDPSHPDPTKYNSADPIVLFIIQLAVILGISRFLHIFLQRIRQPRVISEILGGILLGPTAFGRIPGFTQHIFPTSSLPCLNLVANLGLVLFLFLVGMEVDFSLFRKNLRVSASVAIVGLAIPFGLGCAVSKGLYHQFIQNSTTFPHFMLFIGTSMSITAFPVLARILSELNLMNDQVGVVVLSAGVANDVVGWILLALTVSLVNASSGLVVLYILLTTIGWTLALFFIVRPLFLFAVRKSGSFDGRGPTQTIICAALMIMLASAWVTDQIGVNAIFGGFLAGLIMPRSHGFGSHLTEKVEDLVTVLFIPIFFAESGLKTNLGLLKNGIIWGWTFCVIFTAFFAKFFGCSIMAKACGYTLRESAAVGSLMSCKGLIELIVLSIGLNSGVINQTVFSIFVLEALLLTFTSTPLTLFFYPLHLRTPSKANFLDSKNASATRLPGEDGPGRRLRTQITVVLERLENLGAIMVFTKLIASPPNLTRPPPPVLLEATPADDTPISATPILASEKTPLKVDVVRLVELTDRTSAVMQASEHEESLRSDPLNSLYSTFASINGVPISSNSLEVISQASYPENVARRARDCESDLIVVPWTLAKSEGDGVVASFVPNPFENLFDRAIGGGLKDSNPPSYAAFVRDLFIEAKTDVGVFVDRGTTAPAPTSLPGLHHLFLPFFGGADDRVALEILTQLVQRNLGITATVLRVTKTPEPTAEDLERKPTSESMGSAFKSSSSKDVSEGSPNPNVAGPAQPLTTHKSTIHSGNTVKGHAGDTMYPGENALQSESADDVAFELLRAVVSEERLPIETLQSETAYPLKASLARLRAVGRGTVERRLTVICGRGRVGAMSHRVELKELLDGATAAGKVGVARSTEVRKCLGEVGTGVLVKGAGSNILVVQSRMTVGTRNTNA